MGRPYTAGDIISIFFGVIFGMFAIAGATPQISAIVEGKIAAKMALDVINRKPTINQDNKEGKSIKVQGKIEFKDVSFFYPSRVD